MKKLLLFTPFLFLISCSGSSEEETLDYVETKYDKKIAKFLEDKDYDPERQESGLYIYIENEGSDEKPTKDDYLTLKYEGRLLDGTVFDGTNGEAISFPFPINQLIEGWQEGLPHFGKGGKGKLIIPPELGYGEKEAGNIPPNSILVFDIEIIDFSKEKPKPQIDMSVDYTEEIEAYAAKAGLKDPIVTETGLHIYMDKEGSDEKPTVDNYLTLNYKGYFTDGTPFDEGTKGTPMTFDFPLSKTIMAWQEGIPYFGKGGKGTLVVPPYIGYGDEDVTNPNTGEVVIPKNSILVFDIELIDFSNTPPVSQQQQQQMQ